MTPPRQIRALFDEETITVYQAFSSAIAGPAVTEQRLSASPAFKKGRFTWIKPSWCWMMYRCGYSYKDPGQERVLALRVKHADFQKILAAAILAHSQNVTEEVVKVQWDPERGPKLERYDYRSIQIGLPGKFSLKWTEEWILDIEDVTEKARALKKAVDENPEVTEHQLRETGLFPCERVYDEFVPDEIKSQLGMEKLGAEG